MKDDYSYSIGQARCVIWYHETPYGDWRSGYYVSNSGIVLIHVDEDDNECVLRVPYNGRMYRRAISGKRYMTVSPSRIAGMFLKDVLSGKVN